MSWPLFLGLYALALLWIAGGIVASIVHRRRRGKPIFPKRPSDAVFWQGRASGRSHRTWWSLMGGASNCLQVAVTPGRLIVRPMFPFTLMFLPEIYGLEYDLPLGAVRSVSEGRILLTRTLLLELNIPGKGDEMVELKLKDPDAFVRALGRKVR